MGEQSRGQREYAGQHPDQADRQDRQRFGRQSCHVPSDRIHDRVVPRNLTLLTILFFFFFRVAERPKKKSLAPRQLSTDYTGILLSIFFSISSSHLFFFVRSFFGVLSF